MSPRAYLLDLDGTLYTEDGPVPGAIEVVQSLRGSVPFCCVTNTSSRSRDALLARLVGYGFELTAAQVFTAVLAGAAVAEARGAKRIAPFIADAALPDLAGFELVGGTTGHPSAPHPDAVLIGDLGERWDYALMQEAFRYIMDGADLIALTRDRYWMRSDGLALDAGAFVTGLEYATGVTATVAGKPSPEFFHAAARSLQVTPAQASRDIVVIGDDIWTDVKGAQGAGFQGWIVQTGKFREDAVQRSGIIPDRVLSSIADVSA